MFCTEIRQGDPCSQAQFKLIEDLCPCYLVEFLVLFSHLSGVITMLIYHTKSGLFWQIFKVKLLYYWFLNNIILSIFNILFVFFFFYCEVVYGLCFYLWSCFNSFKFFVVLFNYLLKPLSVLTLLFIIFIISFPTDVYKSVKIQSVYIDEYIRCLT